MALDTLEETIGPIRASETRVFYFEEHFGEPSDVSGISVTGTDPLAYGTSDFAFRSLAADDTHVYWGDSPFFEDYGMLWRSPHGSAAPEIWGTAETVYYPVISGDSVYFHESLDDELYRAARGTAGATLVGTVPDVRVFNTGFWANGTHIFYISSEGITRVGLDGMNPEVIATVSPYYSGAVDATHFYTEADGYLLKITL